MFPQFRSIWSDVMLKEIFVVLRSTACARRKRQDMTVKYCTLLYEKSIATNVAGNKARVSRYAKQFYVGIFFFIVIR